MASIKFIVDDPLRDLVRGLGIPGHIDTPAACPLQVGDVIAYPGRAPGIGFRVAWRSLRVDIGTGATEWLVGLQQTPDTCLAEEAPPRLP